VVDEAADDGESSAMEAFHHCLTLPEISIGLSVAFGTAEEPRFVCSLIKVLATRGHCPLTRGTRQSGRSVREKDPNSI
jgi:hypothetical protein